MTDRSARNIYNVCLNDFETSTDAAEYFMQHSFEVRQANLKLRAIGLSEEATLSLIGCKGPRLADALSHDVQTKSLHYLMTINSDSDPIGLLTQSEKWNLLYLISFMHWKNISSFAHLDLDVYNSFRQRVDVLPKTLISFYDEVLVPCLVPDIWLPPGLHETGYNNMGPVPAVYALVLNFSMGVFSRLRAAELAIANLRWGPISNLDKHVIDCIKAEADELAVMLQHAEEEITEEFESCFDVVCIGECHISLAFAFLEKLGFTAEDITVFRQQIAVISYTTLRASLSKILNGEGFFVNVSVEKRLRIIFAFVKMEDDTRRSFSDRLKHYNP